MRAAVVDGVNLAIDIEQRDIGAVGLHASALTDAQIDRDRHLDGVFHDGLSQEHG